MLLSAPDSISMHGYANIVLLARLTTLKCAWKEAKKRYDLSVCIAHCSPVLSAGNRLTASDFLGEFGKFFLLLLLSDHSIPAENISLLVVGDFNLSHVNKPNHPETRRFVHLFRSVSLSQRL